MFFRTMTAAALACFPFVANSATFMDLPGFGDANFVGGGLEAKEIAVGEIRLGNNGLSGDRELGINTPPPATPKASGQFSFLSGTPYAFDFGYDAGTGLLSLSLGATTISTTYFTNIGAADTIFLRTASKDVAGDPNSTTLSNLAFNGALLGGSGVTSSNGARTYAKITDVDLATSWNLTGDLTFLNFAGTSGSNFAAQFKLVDAVSPVPLPASALLLLAGMGGLAAIRRRAA